MDDIASAFPLALGIILSPLPIVATVALLLSSGGRRNALAFACSFTAVGFLVTLVAGLTSAGSSGSSTGNSPFAVILPAVLGAAFAALAVASWLGRPRRGRPAPTPGWLAAVDTLTPVRAAGLGVLMAATNSKNIPLELKAGAVFGSAGAPLLAVGALCLGFAVVAALGVLAPTALAATGAPGVTSGLTRLKDAMIQHNAGIMTVLFALLAVMEASHLIAALAA
ncbi:GAP family protein [Leifsonia sp. ZF2019]|uniref:GAP family protein n=1 Tax=Leifsonia sp. ZF2019 TaxID=2781978 RepID=UPI001CBF9697|nr:GAP family protein [Leifsonia sp. ZF2019]UAJ78571.1 GAP family protein [Leifsonia sp. ZF2019]